MEEKEIHVFVAYVNIDDELSFCVEKDGGIDIEKIHESFSRVMRFDKHEYNTCEIYCSLCEILRAEARNIFYSIREAR